MLDELTTGGRVAIALKLFENVFDLTVVGEEVKDKELERSGQGGYT